MKRFSHLFAIILVATAATTPLCGALATVAPLYANHNRVPGNTQTMTNIQTWATSITNDLSSLEHGVNTLESRTNVWNSVANMLPKSGGTITGSLAQGDGCTASGDYSHAEGYHTTASGECSHAEGDSTTANIYGSHAEGSDTTASGYYSHAEGFYTTASSDYSHAEGYHTTASGERSHAEGYGTTASGDYSHAEGYHTTASGECSHAEGDNATASNDCSFVWNGDYGQYGNHYGSHGDGTFNINPLGGLAGFYIGNVNFGNHVTNIVNGMADYAVTTSVTNAVETAMTDMLGSNWRTTYGGGLAGIIAALVAALTWLKTNKLTKGMTSGVPDDPNVQSLFSSDNRSLANTMNGGTNAILQAGSNITLTQDATTGKVTIAGTGGGGGTTWVNKESSSSPFSFDANTFNQLPQFTSGQQVTFVLPVPTGNECIDVYAYVDLSGIATGGTVPTITTTVPAGKMANFRNYVGDTMARGKMYTIAYKIMPTATANTFTVISKITELKGFSPFYLDANGYVVVDTENVRVDGTVEYDGDVLSDGTIEIEVN